MPVLLRSPFCVACLFVERQESLSELGKEPFSTFLLSDIHRRSREHRHFAERLRAFLGHGGAVHDAG
jgi:hypothetical protein